MTTPRHASEYRGEDTELVKAGCLTVAAQLGNLMEEIVIIGGYVPTLLLGINVDGEASIERHVGTRDLTWRSPFLFWMTKDTWLFPSNCIKQGLSRTLIRIVIQLLNVGRTKD